MTNLAFPELGFIGVGEMGSPMVLNLLRAGFVVHVFDLDRERLQSVAQAGARGCRDAAECVQRGEWICTSLPSSGILVEVASKVLLPHTRDGQIFLDFGTTIPEETRRLSAEFEQRGARLLDVPVSGGLQGARQAQLKIFAAGNESTFERVRPLLEAIGGRDNIYFCGQSGMGQVVKGVNQLLMGLMAASCLEALSFGARGGVPVELLQVALDGPEAWRQHFACIAGQASTNGVGVGVKFRELPYFLNEAQTQASLLPLTKTLWEFCNEGERVTIDDHRPAPSFWHELTREREGAS